MPRTVIYQGDAAERNRQKCRKWRELNPEKHRVSVSRSAWRARKTRGDQSRSEVGRAIDVMRAEREVKRLQKLIERETKRQHSAADRVLECEKQRQEWLQKLETWKNAKVS